MAWRRKSAYALLIMETRSISVPGLVVAIVYCIVAAWLIHHDRTSTSGGWISLNGMVSALATAPVWFGLEFLGLRPDFRKNGEMAALVLACAVIVYFATVLVVWLGAKVVKGA